MSAPLVSIGLPVYNGARYLAHTLEAILAQDLGDFELLISDNASSDQTGPICQAFAARDARIRYTRQAHNLGAFPNFAWVLEAARGQYFLWAGHDDRYAPSYLRRTLAALEAHPSAVLACTQIRFIDQQDHEVESMREFRNLHTLGLSLPERLRQLFRRTGWYAIYGLARPEHLKRCGIGQIAFGADVLALMRLLLQGDIVCVEERLFAYRIDPHKRLREYQRQFGGGERTEPPYTGLFLDLLRIVAASDCSPAEQREVASAAVRTLAEENRQWGDVLTKEYYRQRRGPAKWLIKWRCRFGGAPGRVRRLQALVSGAIPGLLEAPR